jgi:ribosomal protein L20
MKYLGINFTKEVKNLYNAIYKTLKKEIKEDYKRWKDLSQSWISRINSVKMTALSKAIQFLNVIPIKISMTFLTEVEKSTLKII